MRVCVCVCVRACECVGLQEPQCVTCYSDSDITSPISLSQTHTEKKPKKNSEPPSLLYETLVTSQEGVPPASEEVCVCVCVCGGCVCVCVVCVYTHPPEVLPVGVLGDTVGRVDFAHQGAEAGSFGDVLPAAHTDNLQEDTHTHKQTHTHG